MSHQVEQIAIDHKETKYDERNEVDVSLALAQEEPEGDCELRKLQVRLASEG